MVRVVVIIPVHKVWTTPGLVEARHCSFTFWIVFLVEVGVGEAVITLPTNCPSLCNLTTHPLVDERTLSAVIRSITQ